MKLIRPTYVLLAALTGTALLPAQAPGPAPMPSAGPGPIPAGPQSGPLPAGPAPTMTAPGNASPAPTAAAPAPAAARQRTSPHDTLSARIDGNRVTIVYGRPYSKDPRSGTIRKVWGTLVPAGKPWRTGADEATMLITQQPLDFNGIALPAGAYTLSTLLDADGSAQLLVNKKLGQWGADPYDASQELVKIPLTKETLEPQLDQFTMAVERNPAGGGVLRLKWETTQFSAPFTVKK